jgi:hypothetical protein
MAHVTSGRGDSINFWHDMWNGRTLSQPYVNYSLMQIIKAYLYFQCWKSVNLKIFFISLDQRRLMSNSMNWAFIYKLSRIVLTMVSENIFGVLVIVVQQKLTNE